MESRKVKWSFNENLGVLGVLGESFRRPRARRGERDLAKRRTIWELKILCFFILICGNSCNPWLIFFQLLIGAIGASWRSLRALREAFLNSITIKITITIILGHIQHPASSIQHPASRIQQHAYQARFPPILQPFRLRPSAFSLSSGGICSGSGNHFQKWRQIERRTGPANGNPRGNRPSASG